VTVSAINLYGQSSPSDVGDGADILTVPDAPLNIKNIPEITDATKIAI